jgi:hypothetical protein
MPRTGFAADRIGVRHPERAILRSLRTEKESLRWNGASSGPLTQGRRRGARGIQIRKQDSSHAARKPSDEARERLALALKNAFPLRTSGTFGNVLDAIGSSSESREDRPVPRA